MSKMTIAYPHGGILPASVTGGEEKRVPPHEPVSVPRYYGEHLIHDRFAYEVEPKKTGKGKAKTDAVAEFEASHAELLQQIDAASDLEEKGKLQQKAVELADAIAAEKAKG